MNERQTGRGIGGRGSLNKQGESVWIGRGGDYPAVAIPLGGTPRGSEA